MRPAADLAFDTFSMNTDERGNGWERTSATSSVRNGGSEIYDACAKVNGKERRRAALFTPPSRARPAVGPDQRQSGSAPTRARPTSLRNSVKRLVGVRRRPEASLRLPRLPQTAIQPESREWRAKVPVSDNFTQPQALRRLLAPGKSRN